MKLKIDGIGKGGDPFGKDEKGKIIFVKGNKGLKSGTSIECDISSDSEKYSFARFKKILAEGPMANGQKNQINSQKQPPTQENGPMNGAIGMIDKVLNQDVQELLKENATARNIVRSFIDGIEKKK